MINKASLYSKNSKYKYGIMANSDEDFQKSTLSNKYYKILMEKQNEENIFKNEEIITEEPEFNGFNNDLQYSNISKISETSNDSEIISESKTSNNTKSHLNISPVNLQFDE